MSDDRREFDGLTAWVKDIDNTLQDHTRAEVRMEERITTIEKDISEIKDDLKSILDVLTKARGIWSFLGWVAGAVVTVGGFVVYFLDKK